MPHPRPLALAALATVVAGCGSPPVPPATLPHEKGSAAQPPAPPPAPSPATGDFKRPPAPGPLAPQPPETTNRPTEVDARQVDADDWLRQVADARKLTPDWMPPEAEDLREITKVTRGRFRFKVLQVLDDDRLLIEYARQVILLNAALKDVVDGRYYDLEGLFKPAPRYQYVTVTGATRTVQAVTYSGPAPKLPPVAKKPPAPPPPSTKDEPKPPPAAKAVIVPPKGETVLLADSPAMLAYIGKNPDTRAKWEREGAARVLAEPTEVEVVSRHKDHCRVRLNGKEWCVDPRRVPEGAK